MDNRHIDNPVPEESRELTPSNPLDFIDGVLKEELSAPGLNADDKRVIANAIEDTETYKTQVQKRIKYLEQQGTLTPESAYDICMDPRNFEMGDDRWVATWHIALGHTSRNPKDQTIISAEQTEHQANTSTANPKVVKRILEKLGYLNPGESLTQRIARMEREDVLYDTALGPDNPQNPYVRYFKDAKTGDGVEIPPRKYIAEDPDRYSGTVDLGSPKLTPGLIARVSTNLDQSGDGKVMATDILTKETCFIAPYGTGGVNDRGAKISMGKALIAAAK